ncbi:MAG: peptidylprolyl isomerase [Candidatus Micrarchaeota archaeon]|nr:peptidylprolyl isomerase [Candidatus Micrarchaeota archaeon]MDE1849460.1 peptidylprolyl isomerase [Candidatus Micrarchaeota archaeon]
MDLGPLKSRSHYIAVAAIVAVALLGGVYWAFYASVPTVVDGDNVSVYYTGSFTNGTIFDSNVGGQPLQFTVGTGQVIPGFDSAVLGMKLDQVRNVTVSPDQAYGPVNPHLIMHVPLSSFAGQNVSVGMSVEGSSNGQQMRGYVTSVNSTNATIDFNPPLAGKTLVFSVKVVGIQKK